MSKLNEKVEAIFEAALALETDAQRAEYLNRACPDPALRREVDSLLAAHQSPDSVFVEETVLAPTPLSEGPGTRIGRYKLLQQIGEGGMGVVYMAEQEEPVRRRVALKIIKLGMDTKQVVARFEAERQALALMDHPNIAKVLDGGATDTGRPYFVMELVQGVPITDFCDKAKLSAKERLKLFMQVCQAIQSAHQKGIIHRDIKPSNVLVTLHDGVPVPKVIDFGIAKATNQKLTEKTLFTNFATMIGTPAYMSPEQAEMSGLDIDTRTDIYALGVLLYALLTGTTPFPEKRLRSLGYGEMQRVILEEEPERPSTRLSTMANEQKTIVARNCGEELAALSNLLKGDLDWIVMKCLEKDRQRRYETANGLAADIQRHLSNEPVIARPPSQFYRFQKAMRRNRFAFAAASAVAAALVVGLGISSWMFMKEKQAYRRAVAAEHKESLLRASADKARAEEANSRQKAEEARQREAEQRSLAEMRAYAADIRLAQQALAKHNFGGAQQLLDRHHPQPGQTNRPGWEWRYLWGQLQSDALFKVTQKTGTISSLAVSRDGKTLALSLLNGGVSVLDISNLRVPREVAELPTDGPGFVNFSPREPLLAYSSATLTRGRPDHSTVTLWNAEKKQVVATRPYAQGLCSSLTFLADGKSLAVYIVDNKNLKTASLDLWRIPEMEKIGSYTNANPAFFAFGSLIALTPDQSEAAIAVESLQVIDLSTGAVRWTAKTEGKDFFNSIALSPNGKILFSTEGSSSPVIRIWDLSSGKEIGPRLTDHRMTVNSLIVTADGKTLVSGSHDQTIRLWDISDPAKAKALGRPLQGNRSSVDALALLPDGKTILSASMDGSVYAWDTTAIRKDSNPIILPKAQWGTFDSDGRAITADKAGQILRWQGENFQTREDLFNVGTNFYGACFSRDGRWFATGSTNGAFELWDLPQRRRLGRFGKYTGKLDPGDFSADGKRLIVFDKENQLFCEWDLNTFQQTRTFRAVEDYHRSSFSEDGRWFLSATYMGNFSLEEARTGRSFSKNLEIHNVTATEISPDGKRFTAASFLGYAKVWETQTFRPVATVGEGSTPYYSVNFSPDGTRLITGSGGSEAITLWDLTTELELIRLEGKASQYYGGRFSPDGNVLAAWGSSGDLHLWRAPSWAEIEAAEKAESRTQ